jgi:hypothetical protein
MTSPARCASLASLLCLSVPLLVLPCETALAKPGAPKAAARSPFAARPTPPAPRKSPAVAFGLALGGSVLSWGTLAIGISANSLELALVGVAGITVAPSAGHLYVGGGLPLRSGGMVVRAVGAGSLAVGAALVTACFLEGLGDALDDADDGEDDGGGSCGAARIALVGGVGLLGAGTVLDIVTAPIAAHTHNRGLRLQLAPTVLKAVDGPRIGIGLGGRFDDRSSKAEVPRSTSGPGRPHELAAASLARVARGGPAVRGRRRLTLLDPALVEHGDCGRLAIWTRRHSRRPNDHHVRRGFCNGM